MSSGPHGPIFHQYDKFLKYAISSEAVGGVIFVSFDYMQYQTLWI